MSKFLKSSKQKIAIIGLGYVGLPLAVEFGKKYTTIGYDINEQRLIELRKLYDSTNEIDKYELEAAKFLDFTGNLEEISDCNIYIITVPTPINDHKQPDLDPLLSASKAVGQILKKGDIVVFESTVYPGATEDECVPLLERESGLIFNKDFFVGYSPERINPGDKEHRVTDILKVTSGSNPDVALTIDNLYSSIINAGTYMASSIKVAEAAKIIENTQRDVNIGLINELSLIFNLLEIDTEEVLKAAETKWNFLSFRPGLVGGHCIGVDPYYLTHKARSVGYQPELILAGRRLNDSMGYKVAGRLIKKMIQKEIDPKESMVLIMGVTFKEDCPDVRNTKVIDVATELLDYGVTVECYDPYVTNKDEKSLSSVNMIDHPSEKKYDAVILAVSHKEIKEMGIEMIRSFCKPEHILFDLKYIFPADQTDLRL